MITNSPKITPKIKDKIWHNFTRNTSSKNALKQIFMGDNPGKSYQKISDRLKLQLNNEMKSPRSSLSPRLIKHSSEFGSRKSPKRRSRLGLMRSSPKRSKSSPKRSKSSPKRSKLSPKRSKSSPKRSKSSPKRSKSSPKRSKSSPKRSKLSPKKKN